MSRLLMSAGCAYVLLSAALACWATQTSCEVLDTTELAAIKAGQFSDCERSVTINNGQCNTCEYDADFGLYAKCLDTQYMPSQCYSTTQVPCVACQDVATQCPGNSTLYTDPGCTFFWANSDVACQFDYGSTNTQGCDLACNQ